MLMQRPEDNTFGTIMVEVTNRCNMHCKNCYLPDRDKPDADMGPILNALSRLPRRTNIRIAGAEPTLRNDLPDIIAQIRRLGHRVVLLTNGLRFARRDYAELLHRHGLRHIYISMNGADNNDWYEQIDSMRCADKKLKALENALDLNMIVNTGTILVRDLNEAAVGRMVDLMKAAQPRSALLRFKNIGAIGRFDSTAEQKNIDLAEMLSLVSNATSRPLVDLQRQSQENNEFGKNSHLISLRSGARRGRGVWIKLTNWKLTSSGNIDPRSNYRGILKDGKDISYFFEEKNDCHDN